MEKQNAEIFELAEEAVRRIKVTGLSAKDMRSAALAEFLVELENNPFGIIDAVGFSFAFAATCQQSVNRQMQMQKGITEDKAKENMEYKYVIVDEAARVSPRDLIIPMAQGKRIILVGDHRQLPHIINDEVARQTGETESEWIKQSMFQYLFSDRLKALEQKDGIPRRVTLRRAVPYAPTFSVSSLAATFMSALTCLKNLAREDPTAISSTVCTVLKTNPLCGWMFLVP